MNDLPPTGDAGESPSPDTSKLAQFVHQQFPDLSSWLYAQSQRLRQAPSQIPYDEEDQITQSLHQQREQLVNHFSDIRTQVSLTYRQFAHALESTHDLLESLKTQLGHDKTSEYPPQSS